MTVHRRALGLAAAGAAVLALAGAPQASAMQLGAAGKRGTSTIFRGACKYGHYVTGGLLTVRVAPPVVRGANTNRRTRRERTYVRYRVEVTDANNGYATLSSTGWSGWLFVRQNQRLTWSGNWTAFDMDWRGSYGADVAVEWWNSRRRLGWRWHRLTSFDYYDHYNRGPHGPFSTCYRAVSPFN